MKNLFKKYWHILLVIFLVPVIAIVFILKKFGADGNVVVSLTMSALAYYGTVILAVVTLLQNEKITEISKRNKTEKSVSSGFRIRKYIRS